DQLLEMILVGEADDRFDDLAALEDENRRDAADAELRGGVRVLVDVELADGDLAIVIGRQRVDGRRETPARAAPLRPEIDQDRLVRLHDRLREVAISENLNLV